VPPAPKWSGRTARTPNGLKFPLLSGLMDQANVPAASESLTSRSYGRGFCFAAGTQARICGTGARRDNRPIPRLDRRQFPAKYFARSPLLRRQCARRAGRSARCLNVSGWKTCVSRCASRVRVLDYQEHSAAMSAAPLPPSGGDGAPAPDGCVGAGSRGVGDAGGRRGGDPNVMECKHNEMVPTITHRESGSARRAVTSTAQEARDGSACLMLEHKGFPDSGTSGPLEVPAAGFCLRPDCSLPEPGTGPLGYYLRTIEAGDFWTSRSRPSLPSLPVLAKGP